MERKFPGTLLRVYAHADRRQELRLARRAADEADADARARLECQLCELRVAPPRGSGVAFVVFDSPAAATAALKVLRENRLSIRGGLGELANAALWQVNVAASWLGSWPLREPPMRVEPAPLPSSIAWEHVGVSLGGRMLASLAVNSVLVLILAAIASPALVVEVLYGLRNGSDGSTGVQALEDPFASLRTIFSGFFFSLLFQFLPTLYTLVTMTVVLPALVVWSTRREGHITLSGFRQAVLFKAFQFNCVQFIFILSFGRAVFVALAASLASCSAGASPPPAPPPPSPLTSMLRDSALRTDTPTPPARQTWLGCLLNLGNELGQSGFESTIDSAMGLLCLACSFALAVQLLDFQVLLASLRRRARKLRRFADRRFAAAHRTVERHKEAARWRDLHAGSLDHALACEPAETPVALDGDEEPYTPIGASEEGMREPLLVEPSFKYEHDVRAGMPLWQLPFRIMFFQAHDICILTCVLTFSVISPFVFLPGIVYFAHNWALRKWQFMSCGKAVTTPPDGDKHKAASTMLLYGLLLHTLSACFFVQRTKGANGYSAPQFRLLAAWGCCLVAYLSSSSFYSSLNSRRVADEDLLSEEETRAVVLDETAGYAGPGVGIQSEAPPADEPPSASPSAWAFRFT
jgi:hypothetical protein